MGYAKQDESGGKRFMGLYRAEVAEIDRAVPIGRVRLKIPEVLGDGDALSNWAYFASPIFGGSFCPTIKIGDRVLVWFVGGDPERPVWSNQWFAAPGGESEMPPSSRGERDQTIEFPRGYSYREAIFTNVDTEEEETVEIREPAPAMATVYPNGTVLRLPSGIQIEMDSTTGEERAQVWHPTGSYMEIRPDGGIASRSMGNRFEMTDGSRNELTKGSATEVVDGPKLVRSTSGMEFDASRGPFRVVTRRGDFRVDSKNNAEIRSKGKTLIDAAGVELNARGPLTIVSGSGIVQTSQKVEEIALFTKQVMIGNVLGELEPSRKTLISGDDALYVITTGGRKISLPIGSYELNIGVGQYNVEVAAGTGSINVPAGAFTITSLTSTMEGLAAAEVTSPRTTINGDAEVVVTSAGRVAVQGQLFSVTAPDIRLTGITTVNGALNVSGILTNQGLVQGLAGGLFGQGEQAVALGDSLLGYLSSIVAIFNAHKHEGLGLSPPATPFPAPPGDILSTNVRAD
jgi:hypothetical protein